MVIIIVIIIYFFVVVIFYEIENKYCCLLKLVFLLQCLKVKYILLSLMVKPNKISVHKEHEKLIKTAKKTVYIIWSVIPTWPNLLQ